MKSIKEFFKTLFLTVSAIVLQLVMVVAVLFIMFLVFNLLGRIKS